MRPTTAAVVLCGLAAANALAVRKCCKPGMGLGDKAECVALPPGSAPFEAPPVVRAPGVLASPAPPITILYGRPQCPPGMLPLLYSNRTDRDGPIYLVEDGSLLLHKQNESFDSSVYCLDRFDGLVDPFICMEVADQSEIAMSVYPVGMIVSLPFLLATFFVYGLVPELRNFQGITVMSHVFTLFIAYLFLAVLQLGTIVLSTIVCISFGEPF
ncbi:hypothetical protein AAG570_010414 [Ranatra chinensis]|uniref:Methuselah N-terminal domain-containing protein n=1 Tax=Ranatra chinensis TaxID=642074 RepID=A0ABD0YMJ3_9HEMI